MAYSKFGPASTRSMCVGDRTSGRIAGLQSISPRAYLVKSYGTAHAFVTIYYVCRPKFLRFQYGVRRFKSCSFQYLAGCTATLSIERGAPGEEPA